MANKKVRRIDQREKLLEKSFEHSEEAGIGLEDFSGSEQLDEKQEIAAKRAANGFNLDIGSRSGISREKWAQMRLFLYKTIEFSCPEAINCNYVGSHAPYCSANQHEKCKTYQDLIRKKK